MKLSDNKGAIVYTKEQLVEAISTPHKPNKESAMAEETLGRYLTEDADIYLRETVGEDAAYAIGLAMTQLMVRLVRSETE